MEGQIEEELYRAKEGGRKGGRDNFGREEKSSLSSSIFK